MSTLFCVGDSYKQENAIKYKDSEVKEGTFYLGYRDIPSLLKKYASGTRAIDFGCGTGRSTRFLKGLGYETLGVDVSRAMLQQAIELDPSGRYLHIENEKIPVIDSSCDVIFASFVICTIPTKAQLVAVYKEVQRCLKNGGIFIATTAADHFYTGKWLSYDVEYPENVHLQSGDPVKFYLKNLDIELVNYYWMHEDYTEIAQATSLKMVDRLLPLGHTSDNMQWVSEMHEPPYAIYVYQNEKV